MNQIFVEQAPTYFEAEKMAREKYGDRLTILMHETVKIKKGFFKIFSQDGVRITGIIPKFNQSQHTDSTLTRGSMSAQAKPLPYRDTAALRNVSERIGASERSGASEKNSAQIKPAAAANIRNLAEEKEKFLAMAGAGKDNTLKEVLAEVKSIKDRLENQGMATSREEHPTLNRIDDILILNDFPLLYRKALLERLRKEISMDGLNDFDRVQEKALEWIGESIKIYGNEKFKVRPRIMILVGPTGVGKTTTVAKLAANFGIDDKGRHKRNVVMITIDAYRIGARQQLEKYSEVMEFPCYSAADYDEMKKIMATNTDGADLVLVDTIGKNPRDMIQLGEMKQILDACGSLAEIHLVVASTTKSSDLLEILRHFESFNYRSVIITKLDETIRTGNVIGALSEKGKSVSYITNGQKVPTDIRKASVVQFLINLEGFKVNRIKLEEKFPDRSPELMQQWR